MKLYYIPCKVFKLNLIMFSANYVMDHVILMDTLYNYIASDGYTYVATELTGYYIWHIRYTSLNN